MYVSLQCRKYAPYPGCTVAEFGHICFNAVCAWHLGSVVPPQRKGLRQQPHFEICAEKRKGFIPTGLKCTIMIVKKPNKSCSSTCFNDPHSGEACKVSIHRIRHLFSCFFFLVNSVSGEYDGHMGAYNLAPQISQRPI